jgi:D-3-phosphoglycerate dehydrogenase
VSILNEKIIVSASSSFGKYSPEVINRLNIEGYQLVYDSWPTQKAPMDQVVGLVVSTQPVTSVSIALAPNLKVICKYGAGYDNIDVTAASVAGIYVTVTGNANAEAVAEMALSLTLSISRHISTADQQIRAGKWERYTGHELRGKTVGAIGLGAIGQIFIQRISSFEVCLLGYDPVLHDSFMKKYHVRPSEINEIFRQADFISLHCPLTPQTEKLVNRDRLTLMKPEAYLINTSRGQVIDEEALFEVLTQKKIAGAALDVFQHEPLKASPLFGLDNVILTSHMGAYTYEAFARMDQRVMDSMRAVLKEEFSPDIINFEKVNRDKFVM